LDTRTKIVTNDTACKIDGAVIVSGYFDPLIHTHAGRLASLKKAGHPLVVLIATPANPILPAGARAALVAGLACVDYVTEIGSTYPDGLKPHVQLETEDAARLEQLIQHVAFRQETARQQAAR
jgi:bifunctional ADP-heptose synthase (sugar kinase/adenylyltransferase)